MMIEVRSRLHSCQMYYLPSGPAKDQLFSVQILPSTVTVKSDQLEEMFTFEHLMLKPTVLNELTADESNVVTWRVQSSFSSNKLNSTDNTPKFAPNIKCQQNVQIVCRECHSILLKEEVSFDRILPLPSSDFNAADLFCHECCNGDFEDKLKVFPKNNDLLYGNYFFKINRNLLCDNKTELSKDNVYCHQCKALLGSKESVDGSIKFWNCTVSFSHDDSHTTPIADFLAVVKNVVDENTGPVCRMVVKRKSVPSEYLLLCVMDRNLPLLISTDGSNKLINSNVMKLMYLHVRSTSQIVSEWENDITTHSVDIAEKMFTEAIQYLEKCNQMFPVIFRQASNMNISYLEI